jgi:hypothetical protein
MIEPIRLPPNFQGPHKHGSVQIEPVEPLTEPEHLCPVCGFAPAVEERRLLDRIEPLNPVCMTDGTLEPIKQSRMRPAPALDEFPEVALDDALLYGPDLLKRRIQVVLCE